jgi:hypothetical protein
MGQSHRRQVGQSHWISRSADGARTGSAGCLVLPQTYTPPTSPSRSRTPWRSTPRSTDSRTGSSCCTALPGTPRCPQVARPTALGRAGGAVPARSQGRADLVILVLEAHAFQQHPEHPRGPPQAQCPLHEGGAAISDRAAPAVLLRCGADMGARHRLRGGDGTETQASARGFRQHHAPHGIDPLVAEPALPAGCQAMAQGQPALPAIETDGFAQQQPSCVR